MHVLHFTLCTYITPALHKIKTSKRTIGRWWYHTPDSFANFNYDIAQNKKTKQQWLFFLNVLVLAITIGVRILGPALGFIVGSLCTSVYADLSVDPKIDTTDPRWVGAWWLGNENAKNRFFFFNSLWLLLSYVGLVLISGLLMLASFAMFAFPKRLSSARPTPRMHKTGRKHPSIRGRKNWKTARHSRTKKIWNHNQKLTFKYWWFDWNSNQRPHAYIKNKLCIIFICLKTKLDNNI